MEAYRTSIVIPTGQPPLPETHFRKLTLKLFCEEDISLTKALVEKRSHALESLDIFCTFRGASVGHLPPHESNSLLFLVEPSSALPDLQKVTKLGDMVLRPRTAERRMDHPRTPGRHTQAQRSSTNLSYCAFLFVLPPYQRGLRRRDFRAVVGP